MPNHGLSMRLFKASLTQSQHFDLRLSILPCDPELQALVFPGVENAGPLLGPGYRHAVHPTRASERAVLGPTHRWVDSAARREMQRHFSGPGQTIGSEKVSCVLFCNQLVLPSTSWSTSHVVMNDQAR